jgi:phospholipase C
VCQPLWTANVGGAVQGGPALAVSTLFVGSSNGALHALNADTGASVWAGGTAGSIVGSPAVNRNVVYVGTTTGTLYAFGTGCASGGRSCAPAWTAHANAPIDATPALAYDQVIVGTTSGELYSWSTLACGAPPCSPSYTATLDGQIVGSPAVANGVAYATTRAGSLYALDAKRLGVLSRIAVGTSQASAAVADGDVYVADNTGTLDVLGAGPATGPTPPPAVSSLQPLATPIRHIVVLYQENHSFDNVLGALCVAQARCDGAVTGLSATGLTIPLSQASDNPPMMNHDVEDQLTAIDGGKMDGFSNMSMCTAATGYACYTHYLPAQIPNLAALALRFTISDRTFELKASASFGSHLELASAGLDGFLGDNPAGQPNPQRPGWGCDSNVVAKWVNSAGVMSRQPACVPWPGGAGPFKPTPVPWVPTIMDHLDSAGYTWNIYEGGPDPSSRSTGYIWAICPTLADCVYSAQANAMRPSPSVIADGTSGSLPSLSFVQPSGPDSQHAPYSMIHGDNWIGSVVNAIESGPDWNSTAIFITYDDCGCYYDHVPPPSGLGVRVPMVIVSPYAKAAYTDSSTASLASILAYVEHTLGVQPLTMADANAYDYRNAFDYFQPPLAPVRLAPHPVPKASRAWIRAHPDSPDDPT